MIFAKTTAKTYLLPRPKRLMVSLSLSLCIRNPGQTMKKEQNAYAKTDWLYIHTHSHTERESLSLCLTWLLPVCHFCSSLFQSQPRTFCFLYFLSICQPADLACSPFSFLFIFWRKKRRRRIFRTHLHKYGLSDNSADDRFSSWTHNDLRVRWWSSKILSWICYLY